MLGDNRDRSLDSRFAQFGALTLDRIVGNVLYIYWARDRSRIGRGIRQKQIDGKAGRIRGSNP